MASNRKKMPEAPVIFATSVHLKSAFAKSQQTFGSRRLMAEMHKKGIKIGRYKIRKLMQKSGLVPVWKVN